MENKQILIIKSASSKKIKNANLAINNLDTIFSGNLLDTQNSKDVGILRDYRDNFIAKGYEVHVIAANGANKESLDFLDSIFRKKKIDINSYNFIMFGISMKIRKPDNIYKILYKYLNSDRKYRLINNQKAYLICQDKWKEYKFQKSNTCSNQGLCLPETYLPSDWLSKFNHNLLNLNYQWVKKKRFGRASSNNIQSYSSSYILHDIEENNLQDNKYIIQQYISGKDQRIYLIKNTIIKKETANELTCSLAKAITQNYESYWASIDFKEQENEDKIFLLETNLAMPGLNGNNYVEDAVNQLIKEFP